jgi:phospholipase/carboxylesterase
MTSELSGPGMPPRSGKVRQLVVLLHGLGADGDDLIALAPYFAELLPDAEFISPHAPFACDMAPFGRQWFSLRDRSPDAILYGLEVARPMLDAFLDAALASRGLTDKDLLLVGFSQGTMLSLFTALRRPRACAGLLGYSGMLASPERLPEEITARPPVLLIHGDQDPVVPFEFMDLARQALELLGVPVMVERRPGLGHSIDDEGLASGIAFATSCFGVLQA